MSVIQQFKKSWFINTLGILFFGIAFLILNINEGRAFEDHMSLMEAYKEIISIDRSWKSLNYEDKLIHLTGQVSIQEDLGESNYNILVRAVKLRKIVEMYQWHEDYTEFKDINDESTDSRSYYYYKDWSETLIDSRNFHTLSHQNPKTKPMDSKITVAEKAYIGDFEISEEAKDKFNQWIDVTSDTRPDDYFIKMHGNAYFHTDDLFNLQIGDIRIRFQFAGLEGDYYTIVGQFKSGKIVPYVNRKKRKILLLSKGNLSKEQIFHQEHSALNKELWFTRIFAFILIVFSVSTTEELTRALYRNTFLSFLIVNPQKQLSSYLKISGLYAIAICVGRQALHYVGIF